MIYLRMDQLNTIKLLSHGLTNKEISIEMGIPEDTVRSRVAKLIKITDTKNRAHLVAYAFRHGWIA